MKKLFVLFTATLLVAAFTVPAMAADWSFYGSARMRLFSVDTEIPAVPGFAAIDTRTTTFQQHSNSRIGAKVKAGKVSGYFETGIGLNGGGWTSRKIYGVWKFGGGSLLVGHTYTPEQGLMSTSIQAADDGSMAGAGSYYGSRRGQITLQLGNFKIGLVHANAMSNLGASGNGVAGAAINELTIPRISASYKLKMDPFWINLMGGYLSYDIERGTTGNDLAVDAWGIGAEAQVNLGPAYINAGFIVSQNAGELGLINDTMDNAVLRNAVGSAAQQVIDNETVGFQLVVGYKLSDMIKFEAGYGVVESELDIAGATEDDTTEYYVQATIQMAPGVFLVPEIGVVDFEKRGTQNPGASGVGTSQGEFSYFGAKFQINF